MWISEFARSCAMCIQADDPLEVQGVRCGEEAVSEPGRRRDLRYSRINQINIKITTYNNGFFFFFFFFFFFLDMAAIILLGRDCAADAVPL